MADIEKIEQALRDGLDACTSGPWSVDNHIIAPGDIGESWAVFETCEDDPPIIMCLEWQQEANARHIARCSPENIRALLDELSRLMEVERQLRKDLTFADEQSAKVEALLEPHVRWECASEDCGKPAIVHFERGGIGSYYCHECYMRIQALPARALSERKEGQAE